MVDLVNIFDIGGSEVRNNDQYTIFDNIHLEHLILSQTILKPLQKTNGHKHDDKDEIYFFNSGCGEIQVNDTVKLVKANDIVLIKGGEFHKVSNMSSSENLIFTCVFESYKR